MEFRQSTGTDMSFSMCMLHGASPKTVLLPKGLCSNSCGSSKPEKRLLCFALHYMPHVRRESSTARMQRPLYTKALGGANRNLLSDASALQHAMASELDRRERGAVSSRSQYKRNISLQMLD